MPPRSPVKSSCRTPAREVSPRTQADQRFLEGGRDLHPGGGRWSYLFRAVDSTGATIDFWFSAERDAAAAKRFFQRALKIPGRGRPRVINVDGNPSYPKVIKELKQERSPGRRCLCRTCPYLNNNLEQCHRAIRRRVNACQGFRSFQGAWRTLQGYEVLHMIRKGQVRWLPKGDVVGRSSSSTTCSV
jgi:IS6 family transposase